MCAESMFREPTRSMCAIKHALVLPRNTNRPLAAVAHGISRLRVVVQIMTAGGLVSERSREGCIRQAAGTMPRT